MTDVTISADLSIPAFLRREDTPEEKAGRARTTKQSQRGIRRVVRTGGRSTISSGHAANLDEVGKALLKEVKTAEKHKREERFARLREYRKERAMLEGPKQKATREKREQAAMTGRKPKGGLAVMEEALGELLTKAVDIEVKAANKRIAKKAKAKTAEARAAFNGELPETTAPLADLSAAELKAHKPVDAAKSKKARVTKAKPKNAPKATVKPVKGKPENGKGKGNGTKLELIAGLLTRKSGCTTKDVLEVTGWPSVSMPQQAKAAGLKLKKEKDGSVTRYHAA